jgi:ATP/maltotriose-dependent transcriptional regulator MalT
VTTATAGVTELTDATVRQWLGMLTRPARLASLEVKDLLFAHGRLPNDASDSTIGQAAADLLLEIIDSLRAPDDATREQRLPHDVLRICFVEGAKVHQAARRLGISERQLSRERTWAVGLVKAALESGSKPRRRTVYRAEPIPAIRSFLPRPELSTRLAAQLDKHRLTLVVGPPGMGKTALVADLAAREPASVRTLWYRFRPGVNDRFGALLFELASYLAATDERDLLDFLDASLAQLDLAIASRLALRSLDGPDRLLVFDDFQVVEEDSQICGFIEETALRLPNIRVCIISRHKDAGLLNAADFPVPALRRDESDLLLAKLGVRASEHVLAAIHGWTAGVPHLVTLAAPWVKQGRPEHVVERIADLSTRAQVQSFLLSTLTSVLEPAVRDILDAASIFRDRFTDEAVAAVANQSLGMVRDASHKLVRAHAATRSLQGEGAFFHASVRDYVYDHLGPERRRELHANAARWFESVGRLDEAAYHRSHPGDAR